MTYIPPSSAILSAHCWRRSLSSASPLALPLRAILMAIDVDGEAGHAGLLQLTQQLRGQRQGVGEDDGLDPLLCDVGYDIQNLRVDQWLAAGNRYVIGVAPPLEEKDPLP